MSENKSLDDVIGELPENRQERIRQRTLEIGRECLEKYDGALRMMAGTKPDNAPGCWGAALAYDENELVCRECFARESCKSVSEQRAKALRASLGVETLVNAARPVKRHKPLKQAEKAPSVDGSDKASLPLKVRELLGRLERKGIDLRDRRKSGDYEELPSFLSWSLKSLECQPETRKGLGNILIKILDWTQGTADAHVGQVFCLLKHLDIADEIDGKLVLK